MNILSKNPVWFCALLVLLIDKQTAIWDDSILPYPVVLPELVLREDGWGDVAPLMLFSSLLHCFFVAFLGLNRHMTFFVRFS